MIYHRSATLVFFGFSMARPNSSENMMTLAPPPSC